MQHHTQVTILQELMRQLDAGQNIDAGVQYRMPTKDYVCLIVLSKSSNIFFEITRMSLAYRMTFQKTAAFTP